MTEVVAGSVVARLLAGVWRASPPPLDVDAEALVEAVPRIVAPGTAALVWRRIAAGSLAVDPRLAPIRAAAMSGALANAARLARFGPLVRELDAAGVAPVLFKGLALDHAYPGPNLRPLGDFDLVVRPSERARAVEVLSRGATGRSLPRGGQFRYPGAGAGIPGAAVDLHDGLPAVYGLGLDRLFGEAVALHGLGDPGVRAPRPEHHLRLVAVHMLRHGGWRPLWLVDVAALVEAAGPGFDWDVALGRDPVARAWTAAAIGLAAALLGCRPPDGVAAPPPAWVVRTVLSEWRDPRAGRFLSPDVELSMGFVRRRLAYYWVNPVAAAIARGAPPSVHLPRANQTLHFAASVGRAALKAASGRGWRP